MKLTMPKQCPVCGKDVIITSHGYRCTGCAFSFPLFIKHRYINIYEANDILLGHLNILDGFYENDGIAYSAIPVVQGSEVALEKRVGRCPYGNGGDIIIGTHYFRCDKAGKCGISCHLRPRRCYNGYLLTPADMTQFLKEGKVIFHGFDEEGNVTEECLVNIKRKHTEQLKKPRKI